MMTVKSIVLLLFATISSTTGRRRRPGSSYYDDDDDDDGEYAASKQGDGYGYDSSSDSGIPTGALIGIIAASVVILVLIAAVVLFLVLRARRKAQGHERMADPGVAPGGVRPTSPYHPPAVAPPYVGSLPSKPKEPLVAPSKPPSYRSQENAYTNPTSGDEHIYEAVDHNGVTSGVPPPTYTFAVRDGAKYPTIPSELGRGGN